MNRNTTTHIALYGCRIEWHTAINVPPLAIAHHPYAKELQGATLLREPETIDLLGICGAIGTERIHFLCQQDLRAHPVFDVCNGGFPLFFLGFQPLDLTLNEFPRKCLILGLRVSAE